MKNVVTLGVSSLDEAKDFLPVGRADVEDA
jgi:hypothetical protein